ncbi:hypothetical protein B0I35DRAFT_417003 [Stachybotrys elegans]|uniref:FAD/NAD(P)-binding domain-containing protein n=1 Tax=Stachybotrys elegans TaxID=80388 RepID=A0A8K0WWK2_9HYPO|nr:hypothetical protein B0I35DRAFT_417003 [Stachybotrys elegans]
MVNHVVVIGGSYCGLGITHRLLKNRSRIPDLKVTLISKNSHLYWNIASIRAIIPGVVKFDELLQPIEPGLAQYGPGNAEFVVGSATGVDATAKTVKVATAEGDRDVPYDYLVIATGAGCSDESMPWKADGTYEEILDSIKKMGEKVKAAKHITIVGGGSTGCELSAELRYEFKDKTVVLLSGTPELISGDAAAKAIEKELVKLGVEIRKSVRAESTTVLPDGRTEVKLGNGETLITDLYLGTTGLTPNSSFLPKDFLQPNKFIDVDEHFRVRTAENVWALGDVVSRPNAAYLHTDPQSAGVAKNIEAAIAKRPQQIVKSMPFSAIVCATGRDRGAGRLGIVPVPSFMAWALKGRTLSIERAASYINGSHW